MRHVEPSIVGLTARLTLPGVSSAVNSLAMFHASLTNCEQREGAVEHSPLHRLVGVLGHEFHMRSAEHTLALGVALSRPSQLTLLNVRHVHVHLDCVVTLSKHCR